MFHKKVEKYPLWAWLLVGMSAPVAQAAGEGAWLGVAIIAGICGCLCWGIHAVTEGDTAIPIWYCIIQVIFIILILSEIARMAQTCWPMGNGYPTVPLTLLLLAMLSAWDGAERASRVGGVLFWFLIILYVIVLCAGAKDLKPGWLMPRAALPNGKLIIIFLIPAAASFLPREKGSTSVACLLALGVFGVIIALWTAGILSPQVAGSIENPFFEFSKSLSLFGVAERFEALVCFALTLGYFGLFSFLLGGVGSLAEQIRQGWGRRGVIAGALVSASLFCFCPQIPELFIVMLSILFWGILPFLAHFLSRIKMSK